MTRTTCKRQNALPAHNRLKSESFFTFKWGFMASSHWMKPDFGLIKRVRVQPELLWEPGGPIVCLFKLCIIWWECRVNQTVWENTTRAHTHTHTHTHTNFYSVSHVLNSNHLPSQTAVTFCKTVLKRKPWNSKKLLYFIFYPGALLALLCPLSSRCWLKKSW